MFLCCWWKCKLVLSSTIYKQKFDPEIFLLCIQLNNNKWHFKQVAKKKLDWENCKLRVIGILNNFNKYFNKSKSSVSGKLLFLD